MEMWKEITDGKEEFQNELSRFFDNTDVKDDDDQFTPYSYDNYIKMKLALDWGGEQTKYARVKNRLKDNQVQPIGIALENLIIDTRMYEVEY